MDHFYFSCHFEGRQWRLRAVIYANEYLFLYEVEPEDRLLRERYGIKFITQPKDGLLDVRCSNSLRQHEMYEQAILLALMEYLTDGMLFP